MQDSSNLEDKSGLRNGLRLATAIVAAALVILVPLCCYTVDASEYALVTEFGKPTRVVLEPGLGFKYPYQSVRRFDKRLNVYTPASSEFLTLEKTSVVATSTILWRIADPQKFFETVFDRAGAQSRLGDALFAELGAEIGRNPLTAFVSVEPGAWRAQAILAQVAAKCKALARRDFGIDVVDVTLQRFDFPKQNRARVYVRMTSERGRLSMKYRSEGDEEGTKVRAAAERQRSQILSEALMLAQQYRGEGEGDAARIYAEALSKGPDFYGFLRKMEASKSFVPKGTTLVLPADSELFGLLYDSNHYERQTKHAGAPARKERAMR
jgi:modulator of FtsH protease HflC